MDTNPAGLENRRLIGEAFKQWKAVSDCFKDNYKRQDRNIGLHSKVLEMLLKPLQPLLQEKYVSDADLDTASKEINIIISQLIAAEQATPEQELSCPFPQENILLRN